MSEQPKACPFCGWGTIVDEAFFLPNKHICKCNACGARTQIYPTWKEAVKAWNRRADRKIENCSEKPNNCEPKPCEWCKFYDGENCFSQEPCKVMLYFKDEPQTDCAWK